MIRATILERHPYQGDPVGIKESEGVKFSLDCRSECKYNTGESWKSSNYGYAG